MSLSGTVTHSFDNINNDCNYMHVFFLFFCFSVSVPVCVVSCLPWLSLYRLYLALFSFMRIIHVL